MSAVDTKRALREWLAAKNGRVSAREIADDTPLVSRGILKSIQVMDLLLWIEERRARAVDPGRIRPGSFASVAAIHASFFEEEDPCRST